MINRLQEALEGTRDRESHLAERVAASVADGLHVFQKRAFRRARKKSRDERSSPQSQPIDPEMFGTKTP